MIESEVTCVAALCWRCSNEVPEWLNLKELLVLRGHEGYCELSFIMTEDTLAIVGENPGRSPCRGDTIPRRGLAMGLCEVRRGDGILDESEALKNLWGV